MFSKLSLSLAALLALAVATGGDARANPVPSTSDEARELAAQVIASQPPAAIDPAPGAIASTDEARALAGRMLPAASNASAEHMPKPTIATTTDDARAMAKELAN